MFTFIQAESYAVVDMFTFIQAKSFAVVDRHNRMILIRMNIVEKSRKIAFEPERK